MMYKYVDEGVDEVFDVFKMIFLIMVGLGVGVVMLLINGSKDVDGVFNKPSDKEVE